MWKWRRRFLSRKNSWRIFISVKIIQRYLCLESNIFCKRKTQNLSIRVVLFYWWKMFLLLNSAMFHFIIIPWMFQPPESNPVILSIDSITRINQKHRSVSLFSNEPSFVTYNPVILHLIIIERIYLIFWLSFTILLEKKKKNSNYNSSCQKL